MLSECQTVDCPNGCCIENCVIARAHLRWPLKDLGVGISVSTLESLSLHGSPLHAKEDNGAYRPRANAPCAGRWIYGTKQTNKVRAKGCIWKKKIFSAQFRKNHTNQKSHSPDPSSVYFKESLHLASRENCECTHVRQFVAVLLQLVAGIIDRPFFSRQGPETRKKWLGNQLQACSEGFPLKIGRSPGNEVEVIQEWHGYSFFSLNTDFRPDNIIGS